MQYQINIVITSQDDDEIGDDWCFDIEVPENGPTPYELITIAKNGAKQALADHGLDPSGDTH